MKQTIVVLFSSLLLLLFAYTAISKLEHMQVFITALKHAPFISGGADVLAWSVSLTELCTVLLLFFPRSRRMGLTVSIALLAIFTAYLAGSLISGVSLPCSCGGIISSLSWKTHLYVNLLFLGMAVAGYRLSLKKRTDGTEAAAKANTSFMHKTGVAENL